MAENLKIKRALISVSDKAGLIEFAQKLASLGIEIFSTGGTKAALSNSGIPVKSVSEITNFPEILDGRVKTLHPNVHGGLLADLENPAHLAQMEEHNITSIDLLVVNLYPFEETVANKEATKQQIIENIDIGGPAMIRAGAKNFKSTAVVVNPEKYDSIIENLQDNDGSIELNLRQKLAGEAFSHTAYYDSIISNYFREINKNEFPQKLSIGYNSAQSLRYGENPHQKANLYGSFNDIFKQIHGKELSYNNIIDIDAASRLIMEFENETALAIIKHTNPCGVGSGDTLSEAFSKAFATDNVSPFGGIIAMSTLCDENFANEIHSMFTEVLIAPAFTEEALEILSKKKDRRLITADFKTLRENIKYDFRSVVGGMLIQSSDIGLIDAANMEVVTKRQPTQAEIKAMMFGWKVSKHVKSNAIVYAAKDRTLAIGAGQMSRLDSSRIAVDKARLMGLDLKGSIVASDAFFPFADGLLEAAKAGVSAVIQPGGSVRDAEVIEAANDNNIAMIFTGARHFKH